MNVRIEDVVHENHWNRDYNTLCGAAFGPDTAWIRYEVAGTIYNYLARLPKEVEKPSLGEVISRPPDGVFTSDPVTCLLCLGIE